MMEKYLGISAFLTKIVCFIPHNLHKSIYEPCLAAVWAPSEGGLASLQVCGSFDVRFFFIRLAKICCCIKMKSTGLLSKPVDLYIVLMKKMRRIARKYFIY